MSDLISVYDSHTHVPALVFDDVQPGFITDRYFPTDSRADTFDTTDVVIDFEDGDFEAAPYVQTGYINAELPGYATNKVVPPRIAISCKIDPKGKQRLVMERLCRQIGESAPSKAEAYIALEKMNAIRMANRVRRKVETQCVMALVDNAILGQIPVSPGSPDMQDIEVRYYQLRSDTHGVMVGNEQRMKPGLAWGTEGATPYRDVQSMVRELIKHGGRASDLLIAPEAWILLQSDPDFKANFTACPRQHDGELGPSRPMDRGERGEAEYVGWLAFMGHRVEIIVYNAQYQQDDGTWTSYLPRDFVCVLSPGVGRVLCGATTLVNPRALAYDDFENGYVTVPGLYAFSKHIDTDKQTVEIRVESNPIAAPRRHWGWITMLAENTNDISAAKRGPFADITLDSADEGAKYDSLPLPYPLARQAAMGATVQIETSKITPPGGKTYSHAEIDGVTVSGNAITVPSESCVVDLIFTPSA